MVPIAHHGDVALNAKLEELPIDSLLGVGVPATSGIVGQAAGVEVDKPPGEVAGPGGSMRNMPMRRTPEWFQCPMTGCPLLFRSGFLRRAYRRASDNGRAG
jgi:hypothetical protein